MDWWEAPEWGKPVVMKFPDRSRSSSIPVKQIGCSGGPACECLRVRVFAERPMRAEVLCDRKTPDQG